MEKVYDKKNFGIPATILCAMAYVVGYTLTQSYAVVLAALVFAAVVFMFNFEDKVKTAVKQAYIIAFFAFLGSLLLDIISNFILMLPFSNSIMSDTYEILRGIVNITIIVIFGLFILLALCKKEAKLNFVSKMLGEYVQPVYQQQAYQQPVQQQVYQQSVQQPVQQQPVMQNTQTPVQTPVQPQQNVVICQTCGMQNQLNAAFCAKCGAKLK